MSSETVFFGEDKHKIETKPVTLVFNTCPDESAYVERIMITPEMTLNHYNSLKEIDPYTAKFFRIVIHDFPYEVNKKNIDKCVKGFQHIVGLFSLSLSFFLQNVKFGWKHPESYLHPKYQGNIADALIIFSSKEKFIRVITEVKEELLKKV